MSPSMRRVVWTALLVVAMLATGATSVFAADPTTIASSTMVFEGTLTDDGDGSYTGTIAMVQESVAGGGDGVDGFDVYAKNGAMATYDKAGAGSQDYACGAVINHDAYTTAGGWGSFYDPDCADYEYYQLKLDGGEWYLEYVSGGTAYAAPMSGEIDWDVMYAIENGVGAYYVDPETTPESYGYALDNTCTGVNQGPAAWDMDWSWGSEYIPLELPGFDVDIVDNGGGSFRVTLTPAAVPDAPFDSPDYVYTKLWTAPMGSNGRWVDYSPAAGKVVWRSGKNNGYLADLDAYTGEISNIIQIGVEGEFYEPQFSPSGDYVFFESLASTWSQGPVNGVDMEGMLSMRYEIATGTTETIWDISTIPVADIEALTTAPRSDFGWYLTQGGSDDTVILGYRGEPGGRFDMTLWDIPTQTFTDLIDTDDQAEYDGQYFGTDTSKLLYWTEQYPTSNDRRVVILEGGVETEVDSVSNADGLMLLSPRWGNDQSQILSMLGGGWSTCDLVMYTEDGGAWSSAVDVTGPGWDVSDGAMVTGNGTGMGFVCGVRSSALWDGVWLARETPDEVWVDDNYTPTACNGKAWGYDAFATVQEGVDAVAKGGTVYVAEGTYEEQVIIDGKDMTLQGADAATTTILSPDALPVGWMSSAMNYAIVMATNADNVVISDVTVDGALKGNANYRFQGIAYVEAGGTVQNCSLVDVADNPFSGSQHGVALYVYNRDGVERTMNVWDNTFTGFQKNAMALNASGTTPLVVDVRGNTIRGAGPTSVTAQNGVQVWADLGTGVVADNYIEGIAYYRSDLGKSPYVASSILNYYADLTITGNEIVGGHACIYNYNGAGELSDNTITVIKADVFGLGIIATDPPEFPPAPYGDVDEGLKAQSAAGLKAVDVVTIQDNTIVFSGPDNDGTYGVEAEAGNTANDVSLTVTGNTINGFEVGVAIYDDDVAAAPGYSDVSVNGNDLSGNDWGIYSEIDYLVTDGSYNYWGAASGPGPVGPGTGSAVSDYVDYEPWYGDAAMTIESTSMFIQVPAGTSQAELQTIIDNAPYGATIKLLAGTPCHPGGLLLRSPGITLLAEPGACITFGSPALTVTAADVTIQGFEFDGTGDTDSSPAIVVDGFADNCAILDCDIHNWYDGVQVTSSNTSFKLIGNYIHNNTAAALRVNSTVELGGVVTIEGNLFKANGAAQVVNENPATVLVCQYNSWGSYAAPSAMAGVDASNHTYVEMYMDMAPDTDATVVEVNESESFDVALKVDAQELTGLSFKLNYDVEHLTLNGKTFASPFAGRETDLDASAVDGQENYRIQLFDPGDVVAGQGVTVLTLHFTATPGTGNGTWDQYFDISHVQAETSAGAPGGVKIFVNNAGYGAAVRDDISDVAGNDGMVTINGIANYAGFADLQGRANDAGATVAISQSLTLKAGATSASSGAWTSAHESGELLVIGEVYDIIIDAPLYLPSTVNSVELTDRPLTDLALCKLLGGDANDDDEISINDITLIGGNYGLPTGSASTPNADVNIDGMVDILDLVLAAGNYDLDESPWTAI